MEVKTSEGEEFWENPRRTRGKVEVVEEEEGDLKHEENVPGGGEEDQI